MALRIHRGASKMPDVSEAVRVIAYSDYL